MDHKLGEIIVQLPEGVDIREAIDSWKYYDGKPTRIYLKRRIAPALNLWLLKIDQNTINEIDFLHYIRRQKLIGLAQFNHLISYRKIPDDPNFAQQWQYINIGNNGGIANADLDADLAWDVTTGGVSPIGDTIVVCIIDDGLEIDHEDLAPNLWRNHAEIPDNGLDDDDNGYVDDFLGWDSYHDDDRITRGGSHGTPVTGIVGAKGNNGIGIAGVNWDVQIMTVRGGGEEALAIAAYAYPLQARKRYNETGGEKGAFVVATNASWGIRNAKAEDSPIWCAFYDALGNQGILNLGATDNRNVDVDIVGDMPTTCTSDFLLSITNVTRQDEKLPSAGFGSKSIDLGAHGEQAYTVNINNSYAAFGGTSAATPHVTGAVALLYSAPCSYLASLAFNDPPAAAEYVRQAILKGVTPIASLDSVTVTGGRLNLNNSMQWVLDNCASCTPPSSLRTITLTDTAVEFHWVEADSTSQVDLRWRAIGSQVWQQVAAAMAPHRLNGLTPCTGYEAQLRATCQDTITDYGKLLQFTTDGCCLPPDELNVAIVGRSSAEARWQSVLAAVSYNLRWRPRGSPEWNIHNTAATSFALEGLEACTEYELEIQTVCDTGVTNFSPTLPFRTFGCGACLDLNYCDAGGIDASSEWIARVKIHSLDNESGSDDGYGDYSAGPTTVLSAGERYPIELTPGYASQKWEEYFKIWIDYNQDGDFFDDGELVFDAAQTVDSTLTDTLQIPVDALPGSTRLRVAMEFSGLGESNQPEACKTTIEFGEVEDYCIEIANDSIPCLPGDHLSATFITPFASTISWAEANAATEYILEYQLLEDPNWESVAVDTNFIRVSNLMECSPYRVRLKSLCGNRLSVVSDTLQFSTTCPCFSPGIADTMGLTFSGITVSWGKIDNATNYLFQYKLVGEEAWIDMFPDSSNIELSNLEECKSYDFRIAAVCPGITSGFSVVDTFNTKCSTATQMPAAIEELRISPNPFLDFLVLEFYKLDGEDLQLQLLDLAGRTVFQDSLIDSPPGNYQFRWSLNHLPAGLYLLNLQGKNGRFNRKVVKGK